MTDYSEMARQLEARMADLLARADAIEDDLRHPLDADSSEQAVDLADDESLVGVDEVLLGEMQQIRAALRRIESGAYGTCSRCGEAIARERLAARPIATTCIVCASAA
ncbi:MAG: TraR/DksA family transcriptional regulator [Erythrobacter sp.]